MTFLLNSFVLWMLLLQPSKDQQAFTTFLGEQSKRKPKQTNKQQQQNQNKTKKPNQRGEQTKSEAALCWFDLGQQCHSESSAVNDKHFITINYKQERVKTGGEVSWRGLPKRAQQLWWDAGKCKSAQAHQPGWVTSADQVLFPQLQNQLKNHPPGQGHGVPVLKPTQDEVQLSRPLGYTAAFPLHTTFAHQAPSLPKTGKQWEVLTSTLSMNSLFLVLGATPK